MNKSFIRVSRLLLAVSLCFAGCGDSGPRTYPVKGKVLYKNQPLEGAGVAFHPAAGTPAVGQTNAQGEFQLTTFNPLDGAIAGTFVVTVTKTKGGGGIAPPLTSDPSSSQKSSEEMAKKMEGIKGGRPPSEMTKIEQLLPAKYSKKESSPLKATVTASGPNDFSLPIDD